MTPARLAIAGMVAVVLAAVAWAAFAQRGEAAKRAGSAHNLQQWGIALTLYLMDNQNELPAVGASPVTAAQKSAWFNALPPYISKTPLADLPPGERPRPGEPSIWIDPSTKPVRGWDPEVFYFQFGMNAALQPDVQARSFRIFELTHPANIVFLTEVDGFSPSATPGTVAFRHAGQRPTSPRAAAQVLFCDGHVQAVPRTTLVDDPASREAATAAWGVSWFEQ